MTDRQITESTVGLAGRLSHLPYKLGKAEDRGWQSTRNFSQHTPVFAELGPHKTWLSASDITGVPSPASLANTAWQSSRKQQKWLLKAHPEAHLGNECIHDQLVSSHSSSPFQEKLWSSSLFSIGELTDTSDPRKVSSAPLIAVAAGKANDTLRLVKPSVEEWQLDQDDNVSLILANMKDDDESIYVEGEIAGPIRRLKIVVDSKRYNPTRWVIVQRDSGTRIYRPEYQNTPTVSNHSNRKPSRITANMLFFIPKNRTGGSTHSDASFNPGERSKPPQLGLIDERGYWSVWNIANTKVKSRKPTVHLSKCGHIEKGVLDHPPTEFSGEASWHKIIWVGCPETSSEGSQAYDSEEEANTPESHGSFPQLVRSSTLLLCNPRLVKLLDLDSNALLPNISFMREGSRDCILDVCENPQDTQYAFVLTTSKLFVVRVYSIPGQDWGRPEKRWMIALSISHLRNGFDQTLKIAITQGPTSPGSATSLVHLYSHNSARIDLFCITMQKRDPSKVMYHSETVMLDTFQHTYPSLAIQAMCLRPITVATKRLGTLTESARKLAKQQIRFYQLAILGTDMRLTSTLCVSSFTFPIDQIGRPCRQTSRIKRQPKEKKSVLQQISSHFVIRDDTAIWNNEGGHKYANTRETGVLSRRSVTRRPMKMFYEHLIAIMSDRVQGYGGPVAEENGSVTFDHIHTVVERTLENGLMPTTTLYQMLENLTLPRDFGLADDEWAFEVGRIGQINPAMSLLQFDRPHSQVTKSLASLQELHSTFLDMTDTISSDEEIRGWTREIRSTASRQIACDIYLSLLGLVHRQMDFNESQQTLMHDLENMVIDSQGESVAGGSSRAGSEALTSSMQTVRPDGEDAAMTLLRSYTGTGRFVPKKDTVLLDKWEVGANPDKYVFDLDRNKEETPGMQKRAKQLARESRKRRRAETLFNSSQREGEATLPATQPAPETRFFSSQVSQPMIWSSQRQTTRSDPLLAMSQPMQGMFGRRDERPKKKAKKRIGGF